MTDQATDKADDEYTRRLRYLSWTYEAFTAVQHHPDAVRITCGMLRDAEKRDPIAAVMSTAMFVWVMRWWNPYRIGQTAVDRYAVINEIRNEALLAKELAAL